MKRTLTTPQKLAATATVLATAAALTAGAFAGWQSVHSQHQDIGAATVTSTLTDPAGGSWADIDVNNILPGYTLTKYATLTNTGSVQQAFTVTVAGNVEDGLTAEHAGMQVEIQACTTAWVEDSCRTGEGASLTTPQEMAYISAGITSDTLDLVPSATSFLRVEFSFPANDANFDPELQAAFAGNLDRFMVTEVGVPIELR